MKTLATLSLVSASALFTVSHVGAATIFFTESFETPAVTGSSPVGNVLLTTTTFDNAVAVSDNGFTGGGANGDGAFARVVDGFAAGLGTTAAEGDQALVVGFGGAENGRFVWTIAGANTLGNGDTITVTYDRANMFNDGNSAWRWTVAGGAAHVEADSSVDGEGLDTFIEETFSFTVTDATQAITLQFDDESTLAQAVVEDYAIDDIVIETDGTFVPEPSSLVLLGLSGLFVARRRRD